MSEIIRKDKNFETKNLPEIFKNITSSERKIVGYDLSFDVSENQKFIGELYYSNEFKEFFFIKDNFPFPRQSYRITNFNVNEIEIFIELFKRINVNLQPINH